MAEHRKRSKLDDTISAVAPRFVDVQAISGSARSLVRLLGGQEVSKGLWRIGCSSADGVIAVLERLQAEGFSSAPAARAGVAELATASLCRAYVDGTLTPLDFCQAFNSIVYDLCAVEPLHGDDLKLFNLIEEWEATTGPERPAVERRLLSLARKFVP